MDHATYPSRWFVLISARLKVNFKNLFYLILIVTSCVKVGYHEESNHPGSYFNRINHSINDKTCVLTEKSLALFEIERRVKCSHQHRYLHRININKVRSFFFIKPFTFLWDKCTTFLDFEPEQQTSLKISRKIKYLMNLITNCLFTNTLDNIVESESSIKKPNRRNNLSLVVGSEKHNKKAKLDLLRSKINSDTDHKNLRSYKTKTTISTIIILSLIIKSLLVRQNVEINPGPQVNEPKTTPNLSIITFNCNGLGNCQKMRRILTKCSKLINQNTIIMLQETHLADAKSIEQYWKYK